MKFTILKDVYKGQTLAVPYTQEGICLLAGEYMVAGTTAILDEKNYPYCYAEGNSHNCKHPYEDCECELTSVKMVPANEDDDEESW